MSSEIDALFDILEVAMAEKDWERAELMLAKISNNYNSLNEFQMDYYNHCQAAIEIDAVEDYYEPTEFDEWQSYDPDC